MVLPRGREQTVITEAYAKERGCPLCPSEEPGAPLHNQASLGKELLGRVMVLPSPSAFTRLEPFTKHRTTSIPLAPFCDSEIYQTPRHSLCLWQIQVNMANSQEKQNSLGLLVEFRLTKFSLVHLHKQHGRLLSAGHVVCMRWAVMFLRNIISQQLDMKLSVLRPKSVCNRQK